ncbi:TIGR04282 family arsenosugar biosynthesis glycosyltransferase [Desulfogranum mediterraneum]|uniref:TIGR04282 family arsenosugar biosynthesis glycosyltransferase n=1 Tax=Desulfogranum mediterraneum TaxID=160661 RepID=UPI0004111545|nr:TIGR04282 family arsenosugar biosynthesis glycosyltransferase [Desulfogranum mediterraneum]
MQNRQGLIIFSRFPAPGSTKTRLIPCLGAKGAARLQQRLSELVVKRARLLSRRLELEIMVYYTGAGLAEMIRWLGPDLHYHEQQGRDLGERMRQAFREALDQGMEQVVLIGCDIPGLNEQILEKAFAALERNDTVLGPAMDGGYYLIGIKRDRAPELLSPLFSGINWSTSRVYLSTVAILEAHQASFTTLPTLQDIDRPEDLDTIPKAVRP